MANGLQVFDGSGNLVVDQTTSIGRVLGAVTITTTNYDPNANPTTTNQTGSISVPQFASGTGFYFTVSGIGSYLYPEPIVTINSTSISWTRGYIGTGTSVATTTQGYFSGVLYYGVY